MDMSLTKLILGAGSAASILLLGVIAMAVISDLPYTAIMVFFALAGVVGCTGLGLTFLRRPSEPH